MSAFANITVYDGAATPVLHTLVPITIQNPSKDETIALYREELSGLPTEAQVSVLLKCKKLPSGVVQASIRVDVPVMESVSGQNAAGYTAAPKVVYVDSWSSVSYQHPRSTITGRRLARMIGTNILNNIATSVAAATAGCVPELFDTQKMPV
jgi:hypothetical protein